MGDTVLTDALRTDKTPQKVALFLAVRETYTEPVEVSVYKNAINIDLRNTLLQSKESCYGLTSIRRFHGNDSYQSLPGIRSAV